MEHDQHPGPQQGPSEVVPEGPAAEPESSPPQPDVIMSKLPRTRPQHVTDRRRREQARESAAESRPTALRSQKTRPAAAERTGVPTPSGKPAPNRAAATTRSKPRAAATPKPRASSTARPKRPKQAKPTARRTPAPRARRPAAQPPPAPEAAAVAPAGRPRAQGNGGPSLPRLAVDGAVEAAKLPLRVGGRLTLRALDAIARGLRNS